MADYLKPLPVPGPESGPYWEAALAHRLVIQKCDGCGAHWFPPSTICPNCAAAASGWVEVSGRGRIYSFVIYHRLYHPGWEGELPYVVAIVELEEGPRLYANIVGIEPGDVRCDMPVKAVFDDVTDTVTMVKFSP